MPDRIVVLHSEQPVQFLANVCAALAEEVNEPHAWRPTDDELVVVYAETVMALARLRRAELAELDDSSVQVRIIDHLMLRIAEVRAGEIGLPLADVVDRLHAGATVEYVTM